MRLFVFVFVFGWFLAVCGDVSAGDRPNVLFVLLDDFGWKDAGFMGSDFYETPHLDKLAGEPLDLYVNSRLIARGEAVLVNEKFGLRLVDVVSPAERIEKLG